MSTLTHDVVWTAECQRVRAFHRASPKAIRPCADPPWSKTEGGGYLAAKQRSSMVQAVQRRRIRRAAADGSRWGLGDDQEEREERACRDDVDDDRI